MSDESPEYEVGDRVRFVDVHHAHNSDLKSHEGDIGEVTTINHGYDNKILVKFGDSIDTRYRIAPSRVECVDQ